jgi:hypothetical protein
MGTALTGVNSPEATACSLSLIDDGDDELARDRGKARKTAIFLMFSP